MIQGFEFVDNGRTFTCVIEVSRSTGNERWWWFSVSPDRHNRYAPFRAAGGDTRESVRSRIVAYYEALLERRAQPRTSYWRRGAPNGASKAAAAPEKGNATPE